MLARELGRNPELLIAAQPTRGLDVGAIEFVHRRILAERDAGKAVLLISMELEEVMSLSDRILVMYEGKIAAEFEGGTVTEEELGYYMTGGKRPRSRIRRERAGRGRRCLTSTTAPRPPRPSTPQRRRPRSSTRWTRSGSGAS